eukprot:gene9598-10585_t
MASLLRRQPRLLLTTEVLQGKQNKASKTLQKFQVSNYMTGTGMKRSLPVNTVIKFVPQQEAWIVERFGKYNATLMPGLNLLIPIIDEIKYVQSLKEIAIEVPQQSAITRDNVTLHLDGVLYFRVVDPYKASYGVEDPQFAITQIAQTTMRSELGKIVLDDVFKERDALNHMIVEAINGAAQVWGIKCLRYEIRDIQLPTKVKESMQMQVEAERRKRANILESEGQRESAINRANGEAKAILAKAQARAEAINMISKALVERSGNQAAALSIAEQYVQAFSNLAKTNNTVILPSNTGDVASMVAQAMAVFGQISKLTPASDNSSDGGPSGGGGGTALNKPEKKKETGADESNPSKMSASTSDPGFNSLNLLGSKDNFQWSVAQSPTRKRNFDRGDLQL